eukprot:8373370-Heterocapsa_arctica.AAC.1
MLLRLKIDSQAQILCKMIGVLVVMERMPEDRSKTFKNSLKQKLLKAFKAIYTCMCTPVGPTLLRGELGVAVNKVK